MKKDSVKPRYFHRVNQMLRGDLIEIYKVFDEVDDVDPEPLIELSQAGHSSNGLEIFQKES